MNRIRINRSWLVLLLVAFVSLASACGESAEVDDPRPEHERNAQPATLNTKVFLTADEFQQFADDGATVIDARSAEDYAAGHFPGAANTHGGKAWKDDNGIIYDDPYGNQVKVRELGVDNDRPVILYGGPRSKRAGRLFWTLEYFGHGQVYLYPDGYDALKTELDFTDETTTPDIATGDFVLAYRDSIYATADEVRDAVEQGNGVFIDTRRETEYEGSEDRGDPRQGAIPEATWYYWENIFSADDKLRAKDELETEFTTLGLLEDGAVLIPYCQTGTRSTWLYAVLRWLGRSDAQNYDGSWVEWSRGDYPIEQPQADEPATGS